MDIKRYRKIKFHKNPAINKKVEALFLLFDKRSEELKVKTRQQKFELLNLFIYNLAKHEEYEVAKCFKDRKIRMYKKYRKANRKFTAKLLFRLYKFKLVKFFSKSFK